MPTETAMPGHEPIQVIARHPGVDHPGSSSIWVKIAASTGFTDG